MIWGFQETFEEKLFEEKFSSKIKEICFQKFLAIFQKNTSLVLLMNYGLIYGVNLSASSENIAKPSRQLIFALSVENDLFDPISNRFKYVLKTQIVTPVQPGE